MQLHKVFDPNVRGAVEQMIASSLSSFVYPVLFLKIKIMDTGKTRDQKKQQQEKNKPFVDPGLIILQSDSDMRVPLNPVYSEVVLLPFL